MVSLISNISLNPFKPQGKTKANETELGLFYTNDMHGDINRLGKFKTAHDKFLKENANTPNMTLAAGDCLFGSDKQRNSLMVKLFNLMGLDALALGNHEFAGGTKNLANSLEKAEFKSVSANLDVAKDNSLQERIKDKKLVKSAVFMRGGHKFAVIGASPFDSYINTIDKDVKPKALNDTIKAINKETKELEKQGINKIILLSHLGYGEQADLAVARQTEGVDIIIGGHTHTKIDGVNKEAPKDKHNPHKLNLLMSKRNEPVVITQAGGMNEYAGYLNAVFDEKGILKTDKLVNKLVDLNQFEDSKVANDLMEKELGAKVKLADVKGSYKAKSPYFERHEDNPLANAFADAILERGKKYGADISLYHAATIRGGAEGQITNYDVKYTMLPFNNDIKVVDITEKDLVQVLKNTAGSLLTSGEDAQLLRASGMEYSVRNDKEYFLNGGKEPIQEVKINGRSIDVKNPDENKNVRVILNSYLFSMPRTKDIMAKYKENAVKAGNEQEIFMEYLNNHKEIDCNKKEERIKLTASYDGWGDIESARAEVISKLNKTN
ncbi:bifunctional metallophosphatase/5'-nucleotidase [bacterium]|nr:bifunctional metallophosphatase/5'-nucleotidase [bacterium]